MSLSYYSITSNSYKCSLLSGFTQLQKNEEFTDLTLAADGHIIHVHKNILALASPYMKEMFKSLPSQYPVVFLNNVSHKVLIHLLEYIYQGEVNVPTSMMEEFIQFAKSLHIVGIQDFQMPRTRKDTLPKKTVQSAGERCSTIAAHISIGSDHSMHIDPYPRGGKVTNVGRDETDSAVGSIQDVRPEESLIPKTNAVPSGARPSDIAAHISIGNDHTMQIQSYPQNDIQSETIGTDDGFEVHNPETVNESHDLPVTDTETDNMPLVETKKKIGKRRRIKRITRRKHSRTNQQSLKTVIKDNFDQDSESAPKQYLKYKFIVKSQCDTEQDPLGTPNTPVMEIEPITRSQDKQTDAIPVLVDTAQYEMVTDKASDQDQNPQTIVHQDIDDNAAKIQILDDQIIQVPISQTAGELQRSISTSDMTHFTSVNPVTSVQPIRRLFGKKLTEKKVTNIHRKGLHNHPYHDETIYKKHKKGLIYFTMKEAVDYVERRRSLGNNFS